MERLKKKTGLLIWFLIFGLVVLYYFPSFSLFFTHDDFFHFSIAQLSNVKDIINFFNLLHPPSGWPYYRPLTTQMFYAMGRYIFKFNPLPMRVFNIFIFGLVLFLIEKITLQLTNNRRIALLTTLFYALSASHFTKMYFLGTFQETGLAFGSLATVFIFNKYLMSKKEKYLILAFLAFLITLTTKETAIMLPSALLLTYGLLKVQKDTSIGIKEVLIKLLPFFIFDLIFVYLHLHYYGIPRGNSYIYVLSPRIINTLFWYILWGLNLPEFLVDFVGPGFHFLPNLFRYFGNFIIPIFISFGIFLSTVVIGVLGLFIKSREDFKKILGWCLWSCSWFVLWLLPVLFLPWHKFTIYLTLPVYSIAVLLAFIVNDLTKGRSLLLRGVGSSIALSFFITSALTVRFTYKTHWVIQGAKTAERVHKYVKKQVVNHPNVRQFVFYDSTGDLNLPWRPSQVLRTVLSDNNYFKVFSGNKIRALYLPYKPTITNQTTIYVKGRKFLGY